MRYRVCRARVHPVRSRHFCLDQGARDRPHINGHSFVDLDQGIFYRLAIGRRATNERQTPAPIPPRLLAHMRRWVRRGVVTSHFVEWQGTPVKSVIEDVDPDTVEERPIILEMESQPEAPAMQSRAVTSLAVSELTWACAEMPIDRSTRLNSSHVSQSRMPSSA